MAFDLIEKKKKKKKRFANVAQVGEKLWGSEPVIATIDVPSSAGYSKALSWYNYFYTIKEGRRWLETYLKQEGRMDDFKAVRKCPDNYVTTTSCWIAKMMLNGTTFNAECLVYFENKLEEYRNFVVKEEKFSETESVITISPAARVKRKNEQILQHIEEQIDVAINSGFKEKFALYDYLNGQGSNPMLINQLKTKLEKLVEELETYPEDFMGNGKVEYRRQLEFFEAMQADIMSMSRNKQVIRKVRQKKLPTTEKILQGLKYQEKYDPLKLVSIAPSQILGKQFLWIYNTRYCSLQLYKASDSKGFTVKGTTLQNFDETSDAKRLRKPMEMLQEFLGLGMVGQKKYLLTLKTKGNIPNGRVGKDSILLKAT